MSPRDLDALADPNTLRLPVASPTPALSVPESVALREGSLEFGPPSARRIMPPANLLERFLAASSADQFLAMASRYGPLLVDERGRFDGWYAFERCEPLELWTRHQQLFSDVVGLAARLRNSDPLRDEPWSPALRAVGAADVLLMGDVTLRRGIVPTWSQRTKRDRATLVAGVISYVVAGIVRGAALEPNLDFNARRNTFEFRLGQARQDTLYGALATQLLTAVAGAGFWLCANCGRPFVPKRKPAAGRRAFCSAPTCGAKAAIRFAVNDCRRRQRDVRSSRRKVGRKR